MLTAERIIKGTPSVSLHWPSRVSPTIWPMRSTRGVEPRLARASLQSRPATSLSAHIARLLARP